jgi:hypothetical protein
MTLEQFLTKLGSIKTIYNWTIESDGAIRGVATQLGGTITRQACPLMALIYVDGHHTHTNAHAAYGALVWLHMREEDAAMVIDAADRPLEWLEGEAQALKIRLIDILQPKQSHGHLQGMKGSA